MRASLPENVTRLVQRVLTSAAARSSPDVRHRVYQYVAALTRNETPPASVPAVAEPYLRKVALHAYKVLDREMDAIRAAGSSVDEAFEMTVVAAVSAGVTRMELALAALEEVRDAPAS
jgi:alkylhydroperoxidase/carboxymuconolactone decarboxylase family protein YurZ